MHQTTSRKIEARLAEVDYVYNFIATRQNRQSSGLIGVVIPQFDDLYYASLLTSIERAARRAGLTTITQSSHGTGEGEVGAIAHLRSMNADGAIVTPLGFQSSTECFRRARTDFPIVFADSQPAEQIAGSDFVGTSNAQSIVKVVEYLCRTGAPPVFLGMPHVTSNALERQMAYTEQMEEMGLAPRLVEAHTSSQTWQFEAFAHETMDSHFSRQQYTADTILCANDRIAIGAVRAANKHGLFGPARDHRAGLRIAGHDDHPLSRYMYPAITTAGQDVESLGANAVRLLRERMSGERTGPGEILLKAANLKIREST